MRHVNVLVIGAGPAGIAAATAAAKGGCSVLLVDDNAMAGGQIWRDSTVDTQHKRDAARETALENLRNSGAAILMGWRIFDAPEPNILSASSGDSVEQFHYEKLVIATGARERFLPFPGWTMPGVFGAGGLQALVKGGFPVAGKRIVVTGSGPLLLAVATHLQEDGAKIISIAEQASLTQLLSFTPALLSGPAKLWRGLGYKVALRHTPYCTGSWPVEALGETHLTAVRLTNGSRTWEEPCDFLACGFHLVPNAELASLLGCAFRGDFVQVNALQETSRKDVYCVGEPVAIAGLDAALIQGEIAGLACCGDTAKAEALSRRHTTSIHRFAGRLETAFRLRPELLSLANAETIVCRCEDVRFEQLAPYTSWTEAKLQTRCGMGPCQGRICGAATHTIFGWRTTSVRAPLYPVPIVAFSQSNLQTSTAIKETQ
jgi:NADPH-dependent 2,4-dienoyl-CoA reductase/sulfur reductase-like enzyme